MQNASKDTELSKDGHRVSNSKDNFVGLSSHDIVDAEESSYT